MAYSQTDLDAVKAAIASGTLRIRFDGREVEYRTLSDLERVKVLIESELAGQTGTKKKRHSLVSHTRQS
jgi:hypothetical protein